MEPKNSLSPAKDESFSPLSPAISPENFHVSLSSFMLGHDPVIPAVSPSPEPRSVEPMLTEEADGYPCGEGRKQIVSREEASSSEVGTSTELSDNPGKQCNRPCKKHRKQEIQCLINPSSTDPVFSTSQAESSSEMSSSDLKPKKGRTKMAKPASTQTYSNATSAIESSAESDEAPANVNFWGSDSSGNADITDHANSSWTLSEDAKLRGMKEDDRGPTWAEISKVLARPKREVQLRWKVLKDQLEHSDAEDESEEKVDESNDDALRYKDKAVKEEDKKKNRKKKKQEGGKQQNQKGGKWQKHRSLSPSPSIRSGEFPSSPSSSDSDPNDMTFTGLPSSRRQKRYLHRHVHSVLHGRSISPEPDEYFSQRDCDVLASINSKYKQGKYLEMQANFYNVTGRMIPLSVIRDKCERAEEGATGARAKLRKSKEGQRVEKWVSGVDEDDLEDLDS